jgi:short chain dehydrogenase
MPCRGRVPGTLSTLLFSMYGTKSVVEYKGETKSWYYYSIPHRATKRQFVSFEKNGNILMAQTILVTGSTSGFGRLTVETLARQGYSVFAGMRATTGKNAPVAEELRALAEQEQLALHIVEIDITDETSVRQAIDSIVGSTGRLDVVVNNAGISYSGPLEAFTLEQVQ